MPWTDEQVRQWMLDSRGIPEDRICVKCDGFGTRLYSTTATWRGGVGGMTATTDVCDRCWGSGRSDVKWPSHRAAPPASAPPGLVEAVQSLVAEVETVLGWAPSWEVLTPGDVRDVKQAVDRVKAALPASPETPEQDGVRKLYEELLYQVSRKYPGESRHQTAKRMLAEHDQHCGQGGPYAASPETPEQDGQ